MTRKLLGNLEIFPSFDFNEIQNRRRVHKETSLINKVRKIIAKKNRQSKYWSGCQKHF
jgi:hypothetical protein